MVKKSVIMFSDFLISNGIFYFEILKQNSKLLLQGAFFNRFDSADHFNSGTERAEKIFDEDLTDDEYNTSWVEFHKKGPVEVSGPCKLKIERNNDLYLLIWYEENPNTPLFKGEAKLFEVDEKKVLIGHYKYIGK